MSSIPLPALSVRPQENNNDILGTVGKYVQLKSLLQGQQIQKQQVQAGQLENEQRTQDLLDRQKSTRAFQDANGDPQKFQQLAAQYGVSPNGIAAIGKNLAATQQELDKLPQDKLDLASKQHQQLIPLIESVVQAPQEDKQALWTLNRNTALRQGLINEQSAPAQYPGDQQAQLMANSMKTVEQLLAEKKDQREAASASATLPGLQAESQIKQNELKAMQSGGAAPGIPLEVQEANQWLKEHPGKTLADYQKYKAQLVPAFNFNLQNQGATFTPDNPMVQAVANGKMKISDAITYRTPLAKRQEFLQAVMQANPQFNSANYDVEKGVLKDFTSGKSADSLTAFNTAIDHAKQLSQATDALNNGNVVQLNKLGNALGYQFGSDRTTNFNVIKNALSGEISKVFKGGGATDAEIEAVQGPFNAANSPAQLKGAINNAISLMNSKRDALKQRFASGTQAQPNFGEGSSQGQTTSVQAPNGKTYKFKDQASADSFKKAAGIP